MPEKFTRVITERTEEERRRHLVQSFVREQALASGIVDPYVHGFLSATAATRSDEIFTAQIEAEKSLYKALGVDTLSIKKGIVFLGRALIEQKLPTPWLGNRNSLSSIAENQEAQLALYLKGLFNESFDEKRHFYNVDTQQKICDAINTLFKTNQEAIQEVSTKR